MSDPPNTVTTVAQKLHSQSFAPTPTAADYRNLVAALQRVPTEAEARDFRTVWAFEHSAWEAIAARFPTEEVDEEAVILRQAKGDVTVAAAELRQREGTRRGVVLFDIIEDWCIEHSIADHTTWLSGGASPFEPAARRGWVERTRAALKTMLATDLMHLVERCCTVALLGDDQMAHTAGEEEDETPTPCPSLPHWANATDIAVNGEQLTVKGPDGRLDYQALSGAMARVSRLSLSRQHRELFDKLVADTILYEDHCGPAPKKGAASPTDGNVLVAYNRVSFRGPVYRVALLVEMRLAGIGDTHKERTLYVGEMIRRGIFSLSKGGDPLLLGSHPAAVPGSVDRTVLD